MFDAIRIHRRILFFILILLIIPSFVLFGIERFTSMRAAIQAVAEVDGQKITQQEFDAAHRSNIERMRQIFGPQFDVKLADTPAARKNTLEELVQQRVLQAAMRDGHLTVGDQRLQEAIASIPAVQALRKPDGSFDVEGYKRLLASQNPPLSVEGFEARMRLDLAQQQVVQAVTGSVFVPLQSAQRIYDLQQERREVQVAQLKAADYAAQINPSDADIEAYYQANSKRFEAPEKADVEYVVLTADALRSQVSVNADDLKTYYEQNKSRYATDEQRRASHILITVAKDAKPEERAAAKAKAESLLAQVRKAPASFAEVASKNSQDPGSAQRGGDLDFFGKGAMVKPFEDAVFSMKEGEISNLVETDFGYHIIKLTGIKPAAVKPFDEVKAEIEAELKKQLAAKKFAEVADQFTNLVYEQADSFKAVAEKFKLPVQTAQGITRQPNPASAPGSPLASAKFLSALFSDDSLKNKRNTEAVEIAPNVLASGRIVAYEPAKIRPLAEVKDQARALVIAQKSQELARKDGEAKLKSGDGLKFDDTRFVTRAGGVNMPPVLAAAVFKADTAKLPQLVGAEVPGLGYMIARVTKVAGPEKEDTAAIAQQQEQLAQLQAQAQASQYIEALKKRYKVEIRPLPAADGAAGPK
jgi:peptidyl-prolyl cis-trans isomerase D